jgi:hypothetical protein
VIRFLEMLEPLTRIAAAHRGSASKAANAHYFPAYAGWRTHTWVILAVAKIVSILFIVRLWR